LEDINYNAAADLYPSRRYAKTSRDQYRRFETAAEAIQYIMEDRPGSWLVGSFLEVDERRYDGEGIRALYESAAYPLPRQKMIA
jgi:hypothetical protein